MFKIYVLQDVSKGNKVIKVAIFKKTINKFIKRVLRYHPFDTFLCTTWYWATKESEFEITKNNVNQLE